MNEYFGIDMIKTGCRIKKHIQEKNLSVKELQNILHLSCPQPIYRWMKGTVLPSVDHLFAMSKIFNIHMEELLVERSFPLGITGSMDYYMILPYNRRQKKRLLSYLELIDQ